MPEFAGYDYGPATQQPGMDHPHYEWSPLPDRPRLSWPGGSPLAVGALVVLEHYEWFPPDDAYSLRQPSGGLMKLPGPDYVQLTHREYGHRVGVFRILDALEAHGITPTVAVDVLTAEGYPWLVDHLAERGCELVAHGVAASRLVTSKMPEDEERGVIAASLDAIESRTGRRPQGWYSAEGVESYRTPQLLAEAGLDYVCDWPNDEQPYAMTVGTEQLSALPLFLDLDDEYALWTRKASLDSWVAMVQQAATRLHADGAQTGRLLMLTLRPWLTGQPFRVRRLAEILRHISQLDSVFTGTGSELVAAERSGRAT